MARLITFLLQLLGVALEKALPYFLGKKQERLENAEQALKDVVETNAIRDEVARNSANGAVDERVLKHYVD